MAQDGDRVAVHYHGTLDNGEVFDSSRERDEPLEFVVGSGEVIEGFDNAVRGLDVGSTRSVRMESAEAYGDWQEERVIEVPAANAPDGLNAGDQVAVDGMPAVVVEVTDEAIVLDANHPLAGEALTFEIELVAIK